jgi:hypothetical protein
MPSRVGSATPATEKHKEAAHRPPLHDACPQAERKLSRDPTSRELLDLFVERVRILPVLLIVTFRVAGPIPRLCRVRLAEFSRDP